MVKLILMFTSQIEEIKNKLDVVEVVGSYVKLKKTGANYRGVCPFHSEKKPSFFVSPARQMWHCFGCGEGSSIFDFIMKIEGVEFGDALRILAQKAGVELKRQDPQLTTARERLYEICESSCNFFEKQLDGSTGGKKAQEYLLNRGIKAETIKKWRLGYSPNTWQGLSDFLVGKGYQREEIEKAGLAIKSENKQNFYDRFRGRIIFPVFDLNSQVIGFGARVFEKVSEEEEVAKYINTPQTLLYDKSHTLYGLNFAKLAARKENCCVVTEGYTDTIMAHQAGFENTIAVSGTALTSSHLIILKRYTENLLLAFDMDVAGDSATKRGIGLAQEAGFNIKIIKQTEADSDPADVILKDPKGWGKSLIGARSILDFYFDSATTKYDKNTPEGKKEIGKIVLPVIKKIPNKIEQSFWVQKLATVLSVKDQDVLEELKKVKVEQSFLQELVRGVEEKSKIVKEFSEPISRKKILEEKIISLILKEPDSLNLIDIQHLPLFSEKIKNILEKLKQEKLSLGDKENNKKDLKEVIDNLSVKYNKSDSDEELKDFLGVLSLRAEVEYDEDVEEEIQLCLLGLKSIEVKDKLKALSAQIKLAESEKDSGKINNLMEQFNKLTKEL
ncbi:DNA primase [Patescibacteria group bacterium]|nr:DNA primase [Patescibacteria group bacterium]